MPPPDGRERTNAMVALVHRRQPGDTPRLGAPRDRGVDEWLLDAASWAALREAAAKAGLVDGFDTAFGPVVVTADEGTRTGSTR